MKPHLLQVIPKPTQSFSIRYDEVPYFYNKWHFHPEVELVYIVEGSGLQFMGDSITQFTTGDLILVGANLPHYWRCDDVYFNPENRLTAKAIVAHFKENCWGSNFLEMPENKKIKDLLLLAKRGIQLTGDTKDEVTGIMQAMLRVEGTERIIFLLSALNSMAKRGEKKQISSAGFQPGNAAQDTERLNNIYNYSLNHYTKKISQDKIAKIANISPNSFCRYFKSQTKKTYSAFLQELRVGHATKLLIENKLNITQVCFESGFNNITNFYKAFKKVTGKTPLEFQKGFVAG